MSLSVFMMDNHKDPVTIVEEHLDMKPTTDLGILSNP